MIYEQHSCSNTKKKKKTEITTRSTTTNVKCKIKIKNITKTKITSKVFHKQNVKCWVFVLCFYASSLVLRCLVLNFWHGKQSSLAPRRRRRGRICCWKLHYAWRVTRVCVSVDEDVKGGANHECKCGFLCAIDILILCVWVCPACVFVCLSL